MTPLAPLGYVAANRTCLFGAVPGQRLVGVLVASELAGSQITTLMEALPGIATVLRSPVADAMIGMIRAGARL